MEVDFLDQSSRLWNGLCAALCVPGHTQSKDPRPGRNQSRGLVGELLHARTHYPASARSGLRRRHIPLGLSQGDLPDRLRLSDVVRLHLQ